MLLLGSVVLLLVANPKPAMFWAGVSFVAAGAAVRAWAAGYLVKMQRLVTAGPFSLCRNPLYVGSFLISIGYLFMCNQPAAWIPGAIVFWVFHGGAIAYEEKLLCEKFGEEYEDYRRAVPCLIPRLRSTAGQGEFSPAQLAFNNEIRVMVGTFLTSALFGLMTYGIVPLPLEWLSGILRR